MKNERKEDMKLALNNCIFLFAINVQKYLPLAMMVYAVIAVIFGMRSPESGGGTGL